MYEMQTIANAIKTVTLMKQMQEETINFSIVFIINYYKLIYTDKAVLKREFLFPFSHPGGYVQCLLLPIPIKGDYVVCFLGMQTSLCPDLTVPHGQSKIHCRRWNWCQCWQYNVSFWIFFVCLPCKVSSQPRQVSPILWHMLAYVNGNTNYFSF